MPQTSYATCMLCEADCGIEVQHEGDRIVSIRGDERDVASRGYLCPKGVALADVQSDPDRLRKPLRRTPSGFVEIGWDEALDEAGERFADIAKRHGRDALAVYVGNPTGHSYTATFAMLGVLQSFGTKNVFTAQSVDALPRLLVSSLLFGSQAAVPVPDVDRTHHFLIVGANPLVSNGSAMTAPDMKRRLAAIRARGGRVVVIDPRRTETAEVADEHVFVRPGTDAMLLAAMVKTILDEKLARPRALASFTDGLDRVGDLVRPFAPENVAIATGVPAEKIRELARAFAKAESAVCYGRMGTSTQEFGTLASWLVDVLNVVTGNLDRAGGSMFTSPVVDLVQIAAAAGIPGEFGRWRSRVRGLPEFNGELPAAVFAEELETEGEGRPRALLTHAGNPVLSVPNGKRLDRALEKLEFMVSIDIYKNETTRHAHLILPPTFGLERDHWSILGHHLGVRNVAKYTPALLSKPEGSLHDWEIVTGIVERVLARRGGLGSAAGAALRGIKRRYDPKALLALAVRLGPRGKGILPRRGGLTLGDIEEHEHGLDLGPLEPRLPGLLRTKDKRLKLTPDLIVADLARLTARLTKLQKAYETGSNELLLIGRRHLRSNNSWMHNSARLVSGKPRCTLLVHPDDAKHRGLANRARARIESRAGFVEAEVEVTDTVMPGVVSLPHGWGHGREGTAMSVAAGTPGVSMNDVTDDGLVDALSGCASVNGIPVTVSALAERGGVA